MFRENLKYRIEGGSVLSFDLHNGFTCVVISKCIFEEGKYELTLYLRANDVEMLDLIQNDEKAIEADHKTIKLKITDYVSELLNNGYFDKYIDRYKYMLKCFDKGNELFEKERLNADV